MVHGESTINIANGTEPIGCLGPGLTVKVYSLLIKRQ